MINMRRDIKINIANSEANIQTFIMRASKEFSQIKTAIEYLWIIVIINWFMIGAFMSLLTMLPLPLNLKRLLQREPLSIQGSDNALTMGDYIIEGPTDSNHENKIVKPKTKKVNTPPTTRSKSRLYDIDGGYRNRTKRYQKQIRKKIQSKRNLRKSKK